MVHRAMLGSVERIIAILTEHFGGKWPLWLSPRQVMVIPLHETCNQYAEKVALQFVNAGFFAEAELGSKKYQRKIAEVCFHTNRSLNGQPSILYEFAMVLDDAQNATTIENSESA